MDQAAFEKTSFHRFLGGTPVSGSDSLLRAVHDLEAAGNPWKTTIHGPPVITIDPRLLAEKSILSLGSLEGNLEWRLAKAGAGRVVGIEGSTDNFQKCEVLRQAFPELPIRFMHSDITSLEIKPGDFDIIYCLGVLYHLEEPQALLEKLRDSRASLLFLTTQLATDPPHRSAIKFRLGPPESIHYGGEAYRGRRYIEHHIDGRPGLPAFWFYPDELRRLITRLGFQIALWDEADKRQGGLVVTVVLEPPRAHRRRRLLGALERLAGRILGRPGT